MYVCTWHITSRVHVERDNHARDHIPEASVTFSHRLRAVGQRTSKRARARARESTGLFHNAGQVSVSGRGDSNGTGRYVDSRSRLYACIRNPRRVSLTISVPRRPNGRRCKRANPAKRGFAGSTALGRAHASYVASPA